MRILHILGDKQLSPDPDRAGASGIVRVALELARAQQRRGHHTVVATVGPASWVSSWQGVKLICLRQAPWARYRLGIYSGDFRVHFPYMLFTARGKFDVVQGSPHYYLRFLRAGIRAVNIQTDLFHHRAGGRFAPVDEQALQLIIRDSDIQFTASQFLAHQLTNRLGGAGNIVTVHNGVDSEWFDGRRWSSERQRLRSGWVANSDDVVVLYAGAIVPEKGVLHLVRAFARAQERQTRLHLVLAGAGSLWGSTREQVDQVVNDYERAVQAAIEHVPDHRRVHVLGKVAAASMPALYAASDLVCIPSVWNDPFPLVSLEALATGRPVVASRVGGLPETVSAANGLIVEPGDDIALCEALCTLAGDRGLREELGVQARERARSFSWNQAARQMEAAYMSFAGNCN